MAAFARLWRRAPLWRLALVAAATATILAWLYPVDGGKAAATRDAMLSAGFVAGPAPILGPPYRMVAPVLARSIPLPPGTWHMITMTGTKRNGALVFARMLLARLQDSRLTRLITVQGTMMPLNSAGMVDHYLCITPNDWDGWNAVPSGTVQQECWNFRPRRLPAAWLEPAQAAGLPERVAPAAGRRRGDSACHDGGELVPGRRCAGHSG